jgi:hypothetical protein
MAMDEVVLMAVESNGTLHCHLCQVECLSLCQACHKPFCDKHVSSLDNSFCIACVDFQNTRIESKPLVDDEGVTHKGRHLILTGETWMRNRDVIAKMTDVELEAKLTSLKTAVHEAEMILDFRRIALSQVESEKGDRYSRKLSRRRLIGAMDSVHKSATKVAGTPSEKVEVAKDALKALKNLGLNKDAVANILLKLAQQKGKP